jgi:sugar lactone lactonase YvrE
VSEVLDSIVAVPLPPSGRAWGSAGPGLDILFFTAARKHLDAAARAAQPNAGGILAVQPGTVGQPTASYEV